MARKIRWSQHIEDKIDTELSWLGVTKALLRKVIGKYDEVLLDTENGRKVAVKFDRHVAIIYEEGVEDIFYYNGYL